MFPRYGQLAHRTFSVGAGKSVGFIGLGCMGQPMASNLTKAGYTVKGYDLTDEARQKANEVGVPTVDSIAEACTEVDYVVTALPQTASCASAARCPCWTSCISGRRCLCARSFGAARRSPCLALLVLAAR